MIRHKSQLMALELTQRQRVILEKYLHKQTIAQKIKLRINIILLCSGKKVYPL